MCKDTWSRCACGREEIIMKEECQFFMKNVSLLSDGFSDKSKPYLRNLEKCLNISKKLLDREAKKCTRCSNLRQAPMQFKEDETREQYTKDDKVTANGRERIDSDHESSDEGSSGGVLLPSPIEAGSTPESPEGGVPLPPEWDLKSERRLKEDYGARAPLAWSPLSSEKEFATRADPKDLSDVEQI